MDDVVVHYTRLPDRRTVFRQAFVAREGECTITLMECTPLERPVVAGDSIILEPDAPVVWFTFDGLWHDIGRFHSAEGAFTGCYANVLTPVRFTSAREWATTDLCLDVFLHASGEARLLDADELEAAVAAGWLDDGTAARARLEADAILAAAHAGAWPPTVVRDWTLERARAYVHGR